MKQMWHKAQKLYRTMIDSTENYLRLAIKMHILINNTPVQRCESIIVTFYYSVSVLYTAQPSPSSLLNFC